MPGFIGSIKDNYLATGSGILPFQDAQRALSFVFDHYEYQIPFWFSLPNRSFFEKDVVRFCDNLPGFKVDEFQKKAWIDTRCPGFEAALEECVTRCMALDAGYFAFSQQNSPSLYLLSQRLMGMNWQGWVKFQVLGPLSAGVGLCDENGKPLIFHEELGELVPLVLSLKTAWLIRQFRANVKTKMIVVIDESSICLSAMELPLEEIIERLNSLIEVIHDNEALCALRISNVKDCVFTQRLSIDLLHFDVCGNFEVLAEFEKALASFLKRGGVPILGCVPVEQEGLQGFDLRNRLFQKIKPHQFLLKNGVLITTDGDISSSSEAAVCESAEVCKDLAESLRLMF